METELGFNVPGLYHLSHRFQLLLEVDGETVLSDEEEGETVTNVAPAVKIRLIEDSALFVGLGVGAPVTDMEELDTRVVASVFYHF